MFMRRLMYLFATDDVGGAAPAEVDSAVDQPTPGGESTEEQINWEKRAADNQAWATKAAQEAAEYRSLLDDEEAFRRHAQEKFGYSFVDPEPEHDFSDDPVEALRMEVATLKEQWQTEQQAATAQAEMAQAIQAGEAHVAQEFQAIERADLTDEDQAWIVSRALSLPADQSGMPDIKTAYKEFEAFEERRMKQWAASKRTTHRVSPSGGAGERVPDTAKHDGRVEMMMTRLQDAAS